MTGCVLVARTVSACRHGKAPSRDSPHATCARTSLEQADLRGKYLRWSNFPSRRGFNSDPARASCSVRTGWLSSSLWGLCCEITCEPPALRPCGVVASVPLPCIQHDHWPNGNPPWPICPQFPLYPQVKVKKKVFRHAHQHPRISSARAPGDPRPNLDVPRP